MNKESIILGNMLKMGNSGFKAQGGTIRKRDGKE